MKKNDDDNKKKLIRKNSLSCLFTCKKKDAMCLQAIFFLLFRLFIHVCVCVCSDECLNWHYKKKCRKCFYSVFVCVCVYVKKISPTLIPSAYSCGCCCCSRRRHRRSIGPKVKEPYFILNKKDMNIKNVNVSIYLYFFRFFSFRQFLMMIVIL